MQQSHRRRHRRPSGRVVPVAVGRLGFGSDQYAPAPPPARSEVREEAAGPDAACKPVTVARLAVAAEARTAGTRVPAPAFC